MSCAGAQSSFQKDPLCIQRHDASTGSVHLKTATTSCADQHCMPVQDVVSEEPERFFIGEIVREQIFLQYQQEIPYSSTVPFSALHIAWQQQQVLSKSMAVTQAEVIEYSERPEGTKDLIRVVVTVESESQKAIIIGKGGSALKKLSTESRKGIEEFLGESSPLHAT